MQGGGAQVGHLVQVHPQAVAKRQKAVGGKGMGVIRD